MPTLGPKVLYPWALCLSCHQCRTVGRGLSGPRPRPGLWALWGADTCPEPSALREHLPGWALGFCPRLSVCPTTGDPAACLLGMCEDKVRVDSVKPGGGDRLSSLEHVSCLVHHTHRHLNPCVSPARDGSRTL